MAFTVVERSLIEKLAQDNGFDAPLESSGAWLGFASTQVPLKLWLAAKEGRWCCAFSHPGVAAELEALSEGAAGVPLPNGAAAVRLAGDLAQLHRIVRRAYQLSATLPDELLHEFERKTENLPRTTEVERLVVQRVGQGIFREGLMRYWENRCAVTGLTVPALLRASHIKPWSKCDSDHERLNVFNGLLLAVHLDAAFDRGYVTFNDDGSMAISPQLSADDCKRLGLVPSFAMRRVEAGHRAALRWHRATIFRTSNEATHDE